MRPNRDVRFSADKSPYKTSASLWAGTVGGVYLSLTAHHIEAGGGIYEPSRDQVARAAPGSTRRTRWGDDFGIRSTIPRASRSTFVYRT